jgi:hypothetical protein
MSNYSVRTGLPATPLTPDPALFGELTRVYNAIKNIAIHYDAVTGAIQPAADSWPELGATRYTVGGMCKIYLPAYEDLDYGNTVGVYDDAGVGKAKKAKDAVLYAVGFCTSVSGVIAGEYTEVTVYGAYPKLPSGTLTPGAKYYQSATTAGVIDTAVTTQCVGFAISDTTLIWMPQL